MTDPIIDPIIQGQIDKRLAAMNARIAAKPKSLSVNKLTEEATVETVPSWADSVRGVPNAILRSALFGVSTNRKLYNKLTLIAAAGDFEVRFQGVGLNQTDLDVWEALLHIARKNELGHNVVLFTEHSLLKALGRGTGKSQHEQLKAEMARLASGLVEIKSTKERRSFAGTLIVGYMQNEETGEYLTGFNRDLLALYQTGYTLVNWEERMELGKNNLAKWLHNHYATHAKPLPYKVETLRDLCGSTTSVKDFKQKLKKALDELKAIGAIQSWKIDENDLVHVTRMPSDSQRRHLAKTQRKRTTKPSSNTVLGHLGDTK